MSKQIILENGASQLRLVTEKDIYDKNKFSLLFMTLFVQKSYFSTFWDLIKIIEQLAVTIWYHQQFFLIRVLQGINYLVNYHFFQNQNPLEI